MEWWPTVHLRGGKLAGAPSKADAPYGLHSLGQAFEWVRQHTGRVCVVDLDAIERRRKDVGLYQDLAARMDVWLDVGPRNAGDVMDMVLTAPDRITVRTHLVRESELLEAVATVEDVVLGVEVVQGRVREERRGTPWPVVRRLAKDHGIPLLVVDTARGMTRRGVDRDTAHVARDLAAEKWYAGGVHDRADLGVLEGMKYDGALVGAAWLQDPAPWRP